MRIFVCLFLSFMCSCAGGTKTVSGTAAEAYQCEKWGLSMQAISLSFWFVLGSLSVHSCHLLDAVLWTILLFHRWVLCSPGGALLQELPVILTLCLRLTRTFDAFQGKQYICLYSCQMITCVAHKKGITLFQMFWTNSSQQKPKPEASHSDAHWPQHHRE